MANRLTGATPTLAEGGPTHDELRPDAAFGAEARNLRGIAGHERTPTSRQLVPSRVIAFGDLLQQRVVAAGDALWRETNPREVDSLREARTLFERKVGSLRAA